MNKRCSKSERPRSARLRRRPSLPIDEKNDKNKSNEEHNFFGNQKNSQSKGLGIPGSFKRLGTSFFDRQPHGASNQTLNIPPHGGVNRLDTKGSFVEIPKREHPKSPRLLPKLDKSQRKPSQSDEADGDELTSSNEKSVKPFLDENRVSKGALQFGKHYSVLPNIAPINKDKA